MSADLRSYTTFERLSLVVMNDCLIKLEHERTQDRIRKFMFDGIESVVLWRVIPWPRIIICIVVIGLPGIAVLFIGETFATVTGTLLIMLSAALVAWYLYCRRTTIRIVRFGKAYDLTGLFRPGKLRRCRDRLIEGIRKTQQNAISRLPEAAAPSSPVPSEPAEPPEPTAIEETSGTA